MNKNTYSITFKQLIAQLEKQMDGKKLSKAYQVLIYCGLNPGCTKFDIQKNVWGNGNKIIVTKLQNKDNKKLSTKKTYSTPNEAKNLHRAIFKDLIDRKAIYVSTGSNNDNLYHGPKNTYTLTPIGRTILEDLNDGIFVEEDLAYAFPGKYGVKDTGRENNTFLCIAVKTLNSKKHRDNSQVKDKNKYKIQRWSPQKGYHAD